MNLTTCGSVQMSREFELASVHMEYSFEAVQSMGEVPPISILYIPQFLVVKPMLWLRRQCAGKGAQAHTVDYRSLMPWDDDAVTDANAGIVKCYVQVPVGLLPHRILQFIHEQAVDHVMTKKFVICRIPHGIPPGAYVSVVFATEDFKHPDVHIVRASGESQHNSCRHNPVAFR